MNPRLEHLRPYPFQRLADLLNGIAAPAEFTAIDFSIGEPRHKPPPFIARSLAENLETLGKYPQTDGSQPLRAAIATWLEDRYDLHGTLNAESQVLPVCGTREALFSLTQCVVGAVPNALVQIPNPGYQIYEGATLLAGAQPYYVPLSPECGFNPDFASVPESVWQSTAMVYVCSPGNPAGGVSSLDELKFLVAKAKTHDFVIVSDECYSELYDPLLPPPTGLLQAALATGDANYRNCVVCHSLSKRSSVPGLRSGFVAGDAALLSKYRLYRSYHGATMPPPIQAASMAAWGDEQHVIDNRGLYRQKFSAAREILGPIEIPAGGFYLWLPTPMDDLEFARQAYRRCHIKLLPGSFLGREIQGVNPGAGYTRVALVADLDTTLDGLRRLATLL